MRRRFRQTVRLMERGVADGLFPAACLLAAREGQPLIHRAFGRADLGTLFDLASLTKPLCTAAVAMRLLAEGRLGLHQPVAALVPAFDRPETRRVRIWHLLAHASGLPAWAPFYQRVRSADPHRRRRTIRRQVARTPLEAVPGTRVVYSDLGFILLEWALERLCRRRLDRLARRLIYRPLGLGHTRFVPLFRPGGPEALLAEQEVAPTERCPWRGRRLHAEVHDDNCHAMGGVAGHAGLFATAHDLHLLLRELCAAFHGARSLFAPRVVRRFFRWPPPADSSRVLGWDTPSGPRSSAGRHFGPGSVGHLGFTGTSVWLDPGRRAWVVLLTNRVHRGREPNPMPAFRPRLHTAVMREMGLALPRTRGR